MSEHSYKTTRANVTYPESVLANGCDYHDLSCYWRIAIYGVRDGNGWDADYLDADKSKSKDDDDLPWPVSVVPTPITL
jgi:hypothetical protein